jgi:tetratricopeptide (TPR) repeat protein
MIVKNEEKNIGDLLGDLQGVVDEIVVVDTGSTDGTLDILQSYGVTIGSFAWCDDFSAARNASIDLASSEYLLWLDADDRVDSACRDELLKLKASLPGDGLSAYLLTVLSEAEDQNGTMGIQLRIFPNLPGVRFEGRLHEQITPSLRRVPGMRFVKADAVIRHMGYFHEEDVEAKGRRNLRIQLRDLEDGNASAMQHFYIAMSYHAVRDWENCLEYIEKARAISQQENWFKYSFNLSTECHLKRGHIDAALQEARRGTLLFPDSGTMHYNLGAVCLKAGDYPQCVEALEKASKLGIELDAFPTPPHIRTTLPHYLGTALEKLGRREKAIQAYRASVGTNPSWAPALRSLGLLLVQSGSVEEGAAFLEKTRASSPDFDLSVTLSLARIYQYQQRFSDARRLYADAADHAPGHRDALAGLVHTSITTDDVEGLLKALEAFMLSLGMDTDREIGSVPEIADLCAQIGKGLFVEGSRPAARKLLDAALSLDGGCIPAHLALSDLENEENRIPQALSHLQLALDAGADAAEVDARVKVLAKKAP